MHRCNNTSVCKHEPSSSSTIARWLQLCFQEVSINIYTFKPHLITGAASSSAAKLTILDIFNPADWSRDKIHETPISTNLCNVAYLLLIYKILAIYN